MNAQTHTQTFLVVYLSDFRLYACRRQAEAEAKLQLYYQTNSGGTARYNSVCAHSIIMMMMLLLVYCKGMFLGHILAAELDRGKIETNLCWTKFAARHIMRASRNKATFALKRSGCKVHCLRLLNVLEYFLLTRLSRSFSSADEKTKIFA